MKRYRVWLGISVCIEVNAISPRALQDSWLAAFGTWVPNERIEEIKGA